MVDKMQLLSGEATARIEKVEVCQDKLSEMLASLPVLEAEVVPLTGSSGSGSNTKGLPGEGAGNGSGSAAGLVSDLQSEVLGAFVDRMQGAGTTSGTACVVEPVEVEAVAVDQEGGRGSGFSEAPPMDTTGLGPQKIFGKGVL
jgi:hypothetical protein